MRNKVKRDVKKAKSVFYLSKLEEHRNDSKKLWKQLKHLGYSSKSNSSSKIVLDINNSRVHEPKAVADCFNSFFTNIAANLVEKLPHPKHIFSYTSESVLSFYRSKVSDPLHLEQVTDEFIEKSLRTSIL